MMREGGASVAARLKFGFETVLLREPSQAEIDVMRGAFEKRLERFRGDRAAARDLVLIGESRTDWSLDFAELAAYTVSASTLLNLDETVNKE
jgi:hypothetical protein